MGWCSYRGNRRLLSGRQARWGRGVVLTVNDDEVSIAQQQSPVLDFEGFPGVGMQGKKKGQILQLECCHQMLKRAEFVYQGASSEC